MFTPKKGIDTTELYLNKLIKMSSENLNLTKMDYDIGDNELKLIKISTENLGWYSQTLTRTFEYPWIIKQITSLNNKLILDVGAGVSPLPIYLAERGAQIVTVDPHKIIRRWEERQNWNEWGFLDYSIKNKNIKSINSKIQLLDFPTNYFDYVYSVSVIEHLPKTERLESWEKISALTKIGGNLLITVDLIPGTENLWNYSEGKKVEESDIHGNVTDLKKEICNKGFKINDCKFLRNVPETRTDCVFISLKK